jgi:hypothetical protein
MPARLVAELSDVDLKDRDTGGVKGIEIAFCEPLVEGGTGTRVRELLQLFDRRGEGIIPA